MVCTSPDPCACTEFSRKFCKWYNTPKKPKKTGLKKSKINTRSEKQKGLMKTYNELKEVYLKANPKCAVFPQKDAGQIHHKLGRTGYADEWARANDIPLLIDIRYFLPVSQDGHDWIHRNTKEAREKGWLL